MASSSSSSSSSSKNKQQKHHQDESNLKVLRELVSQPGNKECFDCQQRGPTYVNMTIGSFVCTTCSGILRGLTPPHRVKSISMATFTQEEIDFLKKRGNEYCKAIWLGLLPPNEKLQNNTKDEQKIKDFMSAKYELKRYYLEPSAVNQLSNNNQKQQNQNLKSEVSSSNNKVQIKNKNINEAPKTNNAAKTISSNHIDFIADFSKVPEPSPLIIPPIKQPSVPQPSFANFDNNPIFNSTPSLFTTTNQNNPSTLTNSNVKINSPPPEDRYAALKDLDSMMKQMQMKDESKNIWSNKETNNIPTVANTSWSAFDQSNSSFISNPFTTSVVSPTASIINNNFNGNGNLTNTNSHSYNPFRQINNNSTINKDFYWFGTESQNVDNVHNNLFSPFFNNSCQPASPGFKANPFMVDSTTRDVTHNSNNPFL